MKLYANTTNAVVQALQQIFEEKRYADKVIEKVLKLNPKWGARDRRFIAETTYDVVRWYRMLQEVSRCKHNDYWGLMGAMLLLKHGTLPDWDEFRNINREKVFTREKNLERKFRQSIPDWLDELGETELGEKWNEELKALNEEASVVLRTNTLKSSRNNLRQLLKEEKVETVTPEGFPDALILSERQNVYTLKTFKEGLFDVQDAGSQLIAPYLQVEPGMRVVDACAGAGGKTLHLAALMKNKGRLLAMDVEQWKLTELSKRARRAGVTNLEAKLIDSSKVIKRLANSVDRLLLDVPCSGSGVLKRNPDAKWKLDQTFLDEVKVLQEKIITDYSNMLKPGGLMVYATCSIFQSENEKQVAKFLHQNKTFELIGEKRIWPSEGFDGFYMALIKRV